MNDKVSTKTTSVGAARASVRGRKAAAPRLTYLIGRLERLLRRELSAALAPLGLTLSQFTALSVLDRRGEASNAQLAEGSFITPQSANEVISVMVSRNWISREPDPNHGRIVVLRLTGEGRDVMRQGMKAVQAVEERMLNGMDAQSASAARVNLELFVRNLRQS
ncbi:MarR family transcriptional regulator [Paraburkholderia sp. MMS20-SJTN17]|uniref:MarR family transcriptional regulator n=1 Tax=Paraburkholderia translucens TaxID=2886945 RepID=A0ABS8KLL6_9BURK|nr:MarR family transcriptional regulator [Paraburkholderia sp. MMS20-SJTN17]MCC8405610.1 MarR family transcriptional regulator [Paraburkholderia sp. MMS20-SJTN17]